MCQSFCLVEPLQGLRHEPRARAENSREWNASFTPGRSSIAAGLVIDRWTGQNCSVEPARPQREDGLIDLPRV
ncbi:MAG TPA: hypothetical protein VHS97_19035, partial [Isosphaeraceae bacterium]|nr:hypothetical protein [Isosphaeraceae bacterium]